MIVPYTGGALKTYNKICDLLGLSKNYIANKEYKYNAGYIYINKKGFLHYVEINKNGVAFDFILTNENTLKLSN